MYFYAIYNNVANSSCIVICVIYEVDRISFYGEQVLGLVLNLHIVANKRCF